MWQDEVDKGIVAVDYRQSCAPVARARDGFWVGDCPADYIVKGKQGYIVVEEKKPIDLSNSLANRRLHRQLRQMIAMPGIERAVLALRCDTHDRRYIGEWREGDAFTTFECRDDRLPIWSDLYNIARISGLAHIVILPADDREALTLVSELPSLLGGAAQRTILAGSDKRRESDRDPFVRACRRLFKGCGRKTAEALRRAYNGDFLALLSDSEDGLKAKGVRRPIRDQIIEVRQG